MIFAFWFLSFLAFTTAQCPQNSLSLDTNATICYSFHPKLSKFFVAEQHCQSFGAHLVSLKSEFINTMITGWANLIIYNHIFFWTGGNNLQNSQEFLWSNAEKVEYSHFPSAVDHKNGSCLSAEVKQGFWRADNCFAEYAFVCEFLAGKDSIPLEAAPLDGGSHEDPTPTADPTEMGPELGTTESPLSCPINYILHQGNCYKFNSEAKSWTDAESDCQKEGGHLASIHSKEENEFIATTYLSLGEINNKKDCAYHNLKSQLWIGFTNASHPYAWSDDSTSDYINWCTSKPDNVGHKESCGALVVDDTCLKKCLFQWNDFSCSQKLKFICKQAASRTGETTPPAPIEITTTEKAPETCPPDYISYEGNCYKYGLNPKSWHDAESDCQTEGGHLASIHSKEENEFIATNYHTDSTDDFCERIQVWMGFTKVSNDFEWSDNSTADFTEWAKSEPNNLGQKESCCTFYPLTCAEWPMKWNDYDCEQARNYVCKQPPSKML